MSLEDPFLIAQSCVNPTSFYHFQMVFGPPEGGPILFLLSPEVSGTSGTMSIYIYIYIYIYICQQHGGHEVGTKSFGYISVKFIRLLLILSAKGLLDQESSSKYYFSQ